ncbi:MAG: CopD family protein [Flavobacteriales bacterium]
MISYGGEFYNIIKAIHIIFMVSYFAGIFYMVRLFIYHTDTQTEDEPKKTILQQQFIKMEGLLWNIITVPAFVLMVLTGLLLLITNWETIFKGAAWMHIKLTFLITLFVYQFLCWKIIRQLKNNIFNYTSLQLRLWNEVATVILFAVVFAVVLKHQFINNWYWALGGLLFFAVLIMLIVRLVKKVRG